MASGMKQKKNMEESRCRYGSEATENMYHVFVMCGRFKALREQASDLIRRKVEKGIVEFNLEESQALGFLEAAKSLFSDSDIVWPLHYSAYYLGHVPKLNTWLLREAFNSTTTCEHFLHNVCKSHSPTLPDGVLIKCLDS